MIIKLNKQDFTKGQVLAPNWYKASICKFEAKKPKAGGDSINYFFTFKLETPDLDEVRTTFNTQFLLPFTELVAALEGRNRKDLIKELEDGTLDFDTDECIGTKLQVKIENGTYEGKLQNEIKAYLPYDAAVPF